MNVKAAKSILQREIDKILPADWVCIFRNTFSILSHSGFNSFEEAKRFVSASLGFIPSKESSSLNHIKVRCTEKGEANGKIYLTAEIFLKMKKGRLWRLSKSVSIAKRRLKNQMD